jgi:hypothetical protein
MTNAEDTGGQAGVETPDAAAHYIGSLARELAALARRNGLDTLGYILDMACIEADQAAKG